MMVQVVEIETIKDKKNALKNFKVNSDILLVASLNNKIFWRNYFLDKTDLLTDESVQRAGDFWQKLMLYLSRDYTLVSPTFLKTYLSEFISEKSLKLQSDTVYKLLIDFQDILYSEDLHEIFDDWISENVSKDEAWLQHLDDLKMIVSVLEDKRWVTRDLLPALLYKYKNDIESHLNNKTIYVSLDFSLSVVEAKMLLALAESNQVIILIPIVHPIENFKWDYQVYKPLSEDSSLLTKHKIFKELFSSSKAASILSLSNKNTTYTEFDTVIAETMSVIGKIRSLLQSGISSHDIVILSPNKERYTLVFDTFMQIEGLHSQSTQDSSLLGLKYLQYIVSKLKLRLDKVETEDLEMSVFQDSPQTLYTDFSKNFTNIYQSEGLEDLIKTTDINVESKINANQFLDWFLESSDKIDAAPFTGILNDAPSDVNLQYTSWVSYLEQVLGAKYLRKSTIHDGVLQVMDIVDGSLQENKHVFIIGLNDKDLKQKQNAFIDSSMIEKIATDIGFVFPSHFSQRKMLATLQLIRESNTVYLSYAKNDIGTNLLEPSIFHFLLEKNTSKPEPSFVSSFLSGVDNQDTQIQHMEGINYKLKNLSATQVESYVKCPFIFYAKNVLKLSDTNILDVDIDPMTNGNIIHYALALLVSEPSWPHVSEAQFSTILDRAILKHKDSIKESNLVESYKEKSKEYLDKFIKFEIDWRRLYPKTKTVGIEYEINAYLDKNGFFHREPGDGRFAFKAKIDRIDTDGAGNYLIMDYKFKKSANHTNIGSWFSKGSLQLAMYAMLLEDIKAFDDLTSVVGGLYFTMKPLQRDKGFLLSANTGLYEVEKGNRTIISDDKKNAYYEELREKIKTSIAGIEKNQFLPDPLDKKNCDNCAWRNSCRASHLN
ncbi:MAG: PD-(D/E)XK nuclease family protein [Bdellovibrionales bacterium]|nr:PD-(D/E)XK nuclease family protein [Bdellovibrionales bacterium]